MPFLSRPNVLAFAALLLLAALLANLYVSVRAVQNLRANFDLLEVSHDVQQTRQRLLTAMLDAETGQRGYILTGQESFLEPYYNAAQRVDSLAARLEWLSSLNPRQAPHIPAMRARVVSKRQELADVLALYQEHSPEAARAAVAQGSGKAEMDALRDALRSIEREATRKMAERRARKDASERSAYVAATFANALLLLLLGFTALIVRSSLRARTRIARELKASNSALRDALADKDAALGLKEAALARVRAVQDQLVQQEKLASLGRLTAGVAHELKNPLNFVTNFAQLAEEMVTEAREALAAGHAGEAEELLADVATNAAKIRAHGRRADEVVRSMLIHARGVSGEHVPVNLHELLDEAAERAPGPSGVGALCLARDYAPELAGRAVRGVPSALARLALNLIENAVHAVRTHAETARPDYAPTVTVRTRRREAAGGRALAEIVVEDNGPGIPAAVLPRVFDPFFTTKGPGKGTGLGLSLAHDIAVGHGGRLEAGAAPDGGARFTLTLPLAAPDETTVLAGALPDGAALPAP